MQETYDLNLPYNFNTSKSLCNASDANLNVQINMNANMDRIVKTNFVTYVSLIWKRCLVIKVGYGSLGFCRLLYQNKIYNLIHYFIAICTRSKSGFSTNYCSIVVFRYRPQGWIILGN